MMICIIGIILTGKKFRQQKINFLLSIYAYRGGRDYQHDCGHAHGGASTIARAEALHPQRPRSLSHGCVPVIILGQVRLPRAPSGILQSRNEVEVLSTITRGKCCEWKLSSSEILATVDPRNPAPGKKSMQDALSSPNPLPTSLSGSNSSKAVSLREDTRGLQDARPDGLP